MDYKQFEIYSVNLNSTKGSEQSGIRPCIILQTNAVSDIGKTTIIVVFTSKKLENIYPYEVLIKKDKLNGLTVDSKIKFDQIRVIDKTRIGKRLGIIIDKAKIKEILQAIEIVLDIRGDFR